MIALFLEHANRCLTFDLQLFQYLCSLQVALVTEGAIVVTGGLM